MLTMSTSITTEATGYHGNKVLASVETWAQRGEQTGVGLHSDVKQLLSQTAKGWCNSSHTDHQLTKSDSQTLSFLELSSPSQASLHLPSSCFHIRWHFLWSTSAFLPARRGHHITAPATLQNLTRSHKHKLYYTPVSLHYCIHSILIPQPPQAQPRAYKMQARDSNLTLWLQMLSH